MSRNNILRRFAVYPAAFFLSLLTPFLLSCGGGGGGSDGGSIPGGPTPTLEQILITQNAAAESYVGSALAFGQSLEDLVWVLEQVDVDAWNDYWVDEFPIQISSLIADVEALSETEQNVANAVSGSAVHTQEAGTVLTVIAVGGIVYAVYDWILSIKDNAYQNITVPSQKIYDQVYEIMRVRGHDAQTARTVASAWALKGTFDVKNGLGILGTIRDSTKDSLVAGLDAAVSGLPVDPHSGEALVKRGADTLSGLLAIANSPSKHCATDTVRPKQTIEPEAVDAEMLYIGQSVDGRLTRIPEGTWDLVIFSPGNARVGIGCVAIASGQTTTINANMVPVNEAAAGNLGDATSGAPGEFTEGNYLVWFMDNVRCWDAPYVYATHRDTFNLEEATCNIPGGGIDCDIKVAKIELQGGFATLEAAQSWFCQQVRVNWYNYWCNHRGARVEIGDGALYTLRIPCDLSNVPYEYP